MRQIRRFLIGFTLLVAVAASYGWAASPASASSLPGGTPVLDNFNRANENPLSGGGNWSSVFSGGAQLLNNAVASSNSGTSTSAWRTSYTGDVEARATVLSSGNNAGVMTDATLNASGQLSGYLWQWQGANSPATFALYREDADTFTTLATFNGFSLTAGDQLALQVIGASVRGWVYHLGSWQQVASATDTTYRTGKLGLRVRGTTPIVDDFGGGPVQSSPQTIVSLTFDDTWGDQSVVGPMLAAHGMHGTFYVNSANVGSSSFMTWPQLQSLQSAGNELAGHTLNHIDLTTVNTTEAQRQVCQDRRALLSEGLNVTDFAYPYGASNATIETIVRNCGYNSARRAWGLCSPAQSGCPSAETIPPGDVFATRTDDAVRAWTTLQDLQNEVINGETTGGWVTLLFHHVCDGCDPSSYSVTQSTLQAFLDWLQPRSANGTVVETVHEVIGGSVQAPPSVADQTPPTSSIACNGNPCSGAWFAPPATVSLSAVDSGTGVAVIRFTTDGSVPTASSPIYSGPFPVSTTTTVKYRAWDMAGNIESTNTQLIQIDPTPPSSTIACNGSTCSSGWYGAGVTVSLSSTDTGGSGVAAIRYTTDGSDPTSSSTLYLAPFTVPATATVKYRAWDNAGNVEATHAQPIQIDTTPPSSSISCNGSACSSGPYAASVDVSLSATDAGSGVAAIRYTTDGSDPTSSSALYNGPFTVSTTTTVKYRAWDVAGNVEATNTQVIQIDTTPPDTDPPVSSIACNGATCSSGWYGAAVSVSLSATDAGSGVAAIRYTTDGSDPTSASPQYTNPFTVSTTTTIKYRAWDNAGNVEGTNTQLIRIDTTAPSSSISCNGSACSSDPYAASVDVSLSATDAGSGVAAIRYTTDGSDPTSSSTLYNGPFTVSATTTVKYRAWDAAGNVEATNTQVIQIDTTPPDGDPPVSSIACNGATCSAGWYGAAVSVSLSATDAGSGVAAIRYTTDGSDPTSASPQYTNPFTVSTTTTIKYRAWDNAGNVEGTNTQLIRIDSTPPSSSVACNGSACSSGWYTASVSVSLSATDTGSGVDTIRYTTDGSDPTIASPVYLSPFAISATTTVKFRAWDQAGNVEATDTQLVQIDFTPPVSSIACNGAACSSGWYTAAVSVSLSATDAGSGVAAIRYTTDGSDPTGSSTLYGGPFNVSANTTVKYRAWDTAGNVEATKSQQIRIDTSPPVSSIACNGAACTSGWYRSSASVSLTATDAGSGVAAIRYTLDGSNPTGTSTLYTGPFSLSATTTVKFRAWDVAGNIEATRTQVVQVDATAPTVAITSPANGATVTGNIKVIASASDAQSGVASVAFYADGVLIATATSSPWQVPWNTRRVPPGQHVLTAIATDRVGNGQTSASITVTVR